MNDNNNLTKSSGTSTFDKYEKINTNFQAALNKKVEEMRQHNFPKLLNDAVMNN